MRRERKRERERLNECVILRLPVCVFCYLRRAVWLLLHQSISFDAPSAKILEDDDEEDEEFKDERERNESNNSCLENLKLCLVIFESSEE